MDELKTPTSPALFFILKTCRRWVFFLFIPLISLITTFYGSRGYQYHRAPCNSKNKQAARKQGRYDGSGAQDASHLKSGMFLLLFFVCFLKFLMTFYLQPATTTILTHNHENNRAWDASDVSRVISIFIFTALLMFFLLLIVFMYRRLLAQRLQPPNRV